MNITASKFYSECGGSANSIYKDFIFTYKSEVEGVTPNKYVMDRIIEKTQKLQSRSEDNFKDFSLEFENGFIYLDPSDDTFRTLSDYFNSKGDLNTKKAGLVLLYSKDFLSMFIDELNISDNLKTNDGVPVIDVLRKEIETANIELGDQLEDLYKRESILRDANINIRYIYLNTTLSMAFNKLRKALVSKGYKDEQFDAEYARLTGEIIKIRNNYLESNNHKTRMSAKYVIETYNIMSYKTFANSYGSASKFRATLRGLIHSDKFYLLDSQYAGVCGVN